MRYPKFRMPVYRTFADSRVSGREVADMALGACLCGGDLLRLAERDIFSDTRRWTAIGYRCHACMTIYVEAPTS